MVFSIVVPVYNVEKYLRECIDSILEQSFKDFELILVDDGSLDNSGNICDRYASMDTRIIVVHKKNEGLSSARNAGIKIAQGEYVVFIDSDDYIQSGTFLLGMSKLIENGGVDVITYGHTCMHNVSKTALRIRYSNLEEINSKKRNERLQWMVRKDKFSIAAWMHTMNREFLEKNKLYFDENYRTEEDIDWIYRVYIAKPEVYGLNNYDYVYRIRDNSICHSERKSYFWKNRYNAILSNIGLLNQSNIEENDKDSLFGYLAFLYCVLLGEIWDEPDREVRKEAFHNAEELRFLMQYSGGKRVRICKIIMQICGLYVGSYFLNKYIHIRNKNS